MSENVVETGGEVQCMARLARLDHVVIAARSLAEGVARVEALLDVKMLAGGQHIKMGTHNALLGLGPDCYLEVIAIDPELPAPIRPRWFALDEPQTQSRLEEGPVLLHWVARVGSFVQESLDVEEIFGPVTPMSRGELHWEITIPDDGSLPGDGCLPSLINWPGGTGPASRLPDSGWRLSRLELFHPSPQGPAAVLEKLGLTDPVSGLVVLSSAERAGDVVRLCAVLSNGTHEVVIS